LKRAPVRIASSPVNRHFTLDGLQAANDRVVRLMDRLELPNLGRRSPDRLHTSSDGQKFEVRVDSLNANYSFKYFGKEQGVAAYTFRDERDLLWYSTVFSAAERESAYVIDGLMHNEVVKIGANSTHTRAVSSTTASTPAAVSVAGNEFNIASVLAAAFCSAARSASSPRSSSQRGRSLSGAAATSFTAQGRNVKSAARTEGSPSGQLMNTTSWLRD